MAESASVRAGELKNSPITMKKSRMKKTRVTSEDRYTCNEPCAPDT